MMPYDVAIWERFIQSAPKAYKSVQYDFGVGDPPPFNPLMDDGEDLNQDALYKLRIDVVGLTDRYIDIIELKPNAGPSTIGQVQGYADLYKRDEAPTLPVHAVIITDRLRPNMEFLCKQAGVQIIVV